MTGLRGKCIEVGVTGGVAAYRAAAAIHCFLAIRSEVDTRPLVAAALAVGPGPAYTGRPDAAPGDGAFPAPVLRAGYGPGKLAGRPALSIVIWTRWVLASNCSSATRPT
mgnify:CR=1 FL=1